MKYLLLVLSFLVVGCNAETISSNSAPVLNGVTINSGSNINQGNPFDIEVDYYDPDGDDVQITITYSDGPANVEISSPYTENHGFSTGTFGVSVSLYDGVTITSQTLYFTVQ